jgi:hypothetical protein
MIRRIAALVAVGASATAAFAISAGADSNSVLRFDARLAEGGFSSQDEAPPGETSGDRLQFRDQLSRGSKVVGRDAGICTRVSADEQVCTFTLILGSGQIVAEGLARDGNRAYTIPVVGGTGRYARARGTFRVTDAAETVAHYEVRLR